MPEPTEIRWWVATDHPREDQRYGVGIRELQRTLEHLRRRGDVHAKYHTEASAGWVDVDLTLPLPIGGATA